MPIYGCASVFFSTGFLSGFFGFLLAESLAKSQINVQGRLIEKTLDSNCPFAELLVHETPLADCLSRCNKDSFSLAAEALLKIISAAANPNQGPGSWPDGQRLLTEYLVSLGIDRKQFHIDDASGLSRANRLSANAITTVLLDVYKSRNWDLYRGSLAVGGTDGTIAKYFRQTRYSKKVFAKTGYISAVKSLSGLCITDSGDRIFAILANNANAKTRKAINDIIKAVIDTESIPAKAHRIRNGHIGRLLDKYGIPFFYRQATTIYNNRKNKIWNPSFTLPQYGCYEKPQQETKRLSVLSFYKAP